MSLQPEGTQTAADLVITTPPTDDAGARTADLFDWQAGMAAADGLGLYFDFLDTSGQLRLEEECRVICEHHEDWVVIHGDDAELVSAKHKEPSYGAYSTINQLMGDGGLFHLFLRWLAMHKKPTCRLVTTPGLAAGQVQQLEDAMAHLRRQRLKGEALSVDGQAKTSILDFTAALLRLKDKLPLEWKSEDASSDRERQEDVTEFLSRLTIQHSALARAHDEFAAPGMYAKPVLERLGNSTCPPESVWQAVLDIFRVRMRAAGPRPRGWLPQVLASKDGTPLPGVSEIERELSARIVTLTEIEVAINVALSNPAGYRSLKPFPYTGRLAIKMTAGECSDNSIERADQLRLDHRRYWRRRVSGDAMAVVEQERFYRALLRIADSASDAVTGANEVWGQNMWQRLQTLIDETPVQEWPAGIDSELALGGICELTNRCKVWFSARFDVDAEVARIRRARGIAS